MAVSFVASASYPTGAGEVIPAGAQLGDLVVAFLFRSDGVDPGISTGWSAFGAAGGSGNYRWQIAWKFYDGDDSLTTQNALRVVHIYRGAYLAGNRFGATDSAGALNYPAYTPANAGAWMAFFVGTANGDNTGVTTSFGAFTYTNGRNSGGRRIGGHTTTAPITDFAGATVAKGGTNGAWRIAGVEIAPLVSGTLNYSEGADTLSGVMKLSREINGAMADGDDTIAANALPSRFGTFAYSEGLDAGTKQGFQWRQLSFSFSEALDTSSSSSTIGRAITGSLTDGDDTAAGVSFSSRYGTFAFTEGLDTSTGQGFVQRNGSLSYAEAADVTSATMIHHNNINGSLTDGDDTSAGVAFTDREATFAYSEAADTVTSSSTIGRAITGSLTDGNDTTAGESFNSRVASFAYTEVADISTSASFLQRNGTFSYTEGVDTLSGVADLLITGNFSYVESNDNLISQSFLTIGGSFNYTEGADAGTKAGFVQRNASFNYTERPDIVSDVFFDFVSQGSFIYQELDDRLLAGYKPEEGRRPPDCIAEIDFVEEGLNRLLTQYRESPNLIYFITTALEEIWEARDALCDLPEYFSLDDAIGDQLTLIGERMGFGRCHCVCAPRRIFGFKCADDQGLGDAYVGFCEDGEWAACAGGGVVDICINDDELYRKFLQVRAYQARQLFDMESLTAAIRIFYGERARVLSADRGQVVIAPFRRLSDTERAVIKLVPRVLPVAPGIKIRFQINPYPNIAGFGEGWGGFCDEIPGEAIFTDGDGNRYIETATGIEYLEEDEDTRNAYWMCPVDVKPYSC